MNKSELDKIVTELREQIADDIGPGELIGDEDAEKAMSEAIRRLNGINPKNLKNATLSTAPENWSMSVQCGAAAILYRERAARLFDADPRLSALYGSMAKYWQKIFDDLGSKLMQIRPASLGGRSRK